MHTENKREHIAFVGPNQIISQLGLNYDNPCNLDQLLKVTSKNSLTITINVSQVEGKTLPSV